MARFGTCGQNGEASGLVPEVLHDGVTTGVGAATALKHMADADVQLLV